MGLPLALYAIGAIVSTYGKIKADQDQAASERANASYYREQELFTLEQMFAERDTFDRKSGALKGKQLAFVGSTGFAITSNVLDQLGAESAIMQRERSMITRNGEFKARLAGMRATQSDKNASALSSPERQASNFIGLLTSAASLSGKAKGFDEEEPPSGGGGGGGGGKVGQSGFAY